MPSYPRACACCRSETHGPMWDLVEPSGRRWLLCVRCATHAEPKTDGTLWLPARCPAVVPRPRFRLLTSVEGD